MPIPVVAIKSYDSGKSPLLNPTEIQFVTKSMLGTTNEGHRKLVGVETMSLFRIGMLRVFQNRNYELTYCVSIALALCRGATARLSIHD